MQIYDISTKVKNLLKIAKDCLGNRYSILERRIKVKSQLTQAVYLKVLSRLCSENALDNESVFNEVVKDFIFSYKNINTRRTYFYACKFIADTLGYKLDIFSEELKLKAEEKIRLGQTFTLDEIERLIDATIEIVKEDKSIEVFSYEIKPFEFLKMMLLTTIYGTRRGEVYITKKKHISFNEQTIYIQALKKSLSRNHLIPSELIDLFKEAFREDSEMPDARYLNDAFLILLAKAGVQRIKRRNIHSIRKTVASQLLMRGNNPVFVNDFLRWKGGGTMLSFYANMEPIFIDVEIFKNHPLLEIWKRKVGSN